MNKYNYEKWLAGHATRKTMMEKLERSLIPYDLFACIPMKNDKQSRSGIINYGKNRYFYRANYAYSKLGNDIYDINITITQLEDLWDNQLSGYNNFKVVIRDDKIITIYADHENFFQVVIRMFEQEDVKGLYTHRSAYVNNLLARYILLQLIEKHIPNMQMLASIKTERFGNVSFMAANANRTKMIMYAFNKRDAIEMAKRFDGMTRHLTIVYFLNQDFEHDGNTQSYYSERTQVISIRSFYRKLEVGNIELKNIERKILMLVSLLYDEQLEWDKYNISQIALNPPTKAAIESLTHPLKNRRKPKLCTNISLMYNKFYRTLLEDALNVLEEPPTSHIDIFHSLCAANMVNAYINYCKRQQMFSPRQLSRMFMAKQQMLDIVMSLTSSPHVMVRMNLIGEAAVYVRIKVRQIVYQFSFRGLNCRQLDQLKNSGIPSDGKYSGISLQAIATALYQYSYLKRWNWLSQPKG